MSQLIQLRQQIKTIQTTKKITHAMRLISMSAHTRLRNQEIYLRTYIQAIRTLVGRLKTTVPHWINPILNPDSAHHAELWILIGSEKGLCGTFNSSLFNFFEHVLPTDRSAIYMIAVGKKAIEHITMYHPALPVVAQFPHINSKNINTISQTILDHITSQLHPFSHVYTISNRMKSFFIQKPHQSAIIPFHHEGEHKTQSSFSEEYLWYQPTENILNSLTLQYLQAQLQYILFQSLISEQAARFISMDGATRNAQMILDATQLQYNKLRQAKITKELTELVGNINP